MDSEHLKNLLAMGDALWSTGKELERKTAMMIYQCGCNMQSPDAYLRLYQAKKSTKFKSKNFPNTPLQDLFAAINLYHVEAIIIAAKENLFGDASIKFFYLQLAEKISSIRNIKEPSEVATQIGLTVEYVPIFMQEKIKDFVQSWIGDEVILPQAPLCRSCKYLKNWDSELPKCSVNASVIESFVIECKLYLKNFVDLTHVDDVKFNMDESYGDVGDDL